MRCLYCNKEINAYSLYSLLIEEDKLCVDCRKALAYHHQCFMVDEMRVETFYDYNSLFKDMILQYKECYDEALKEVFLFSILDILKIKYHGYKILYVPSSKKKIEERGFNHLKEIFSSLQLREVEGLKMREEMCQLSKNYEERLKMVDNYVYEGKMLEKVLIVDDIYTTGSSLKGVYKAIKPYAKKIAGIVLAKT